MQKVNICITEPNNCGTFDELAELLHYAFLDNGYDSSISQQNMALYPNALNIVFGIHWYTKDGIDYLAKNFPPQSIVIVNTEPMAIYQQNLDDKYYNLWYHAILYAAKYFPVWDYNRDNFRVFAEYGISHPHFLLLGYHEKLQRMNMQTLKDIDVLFFGARNERRHHILEQLEQRGLNVGFLYRVYGAERDSYIARAKIVLNMHSYDGQAFEIVRCHYLMNNGVAIVSEVGDNTPIDVRYRPNVMGVPYSQLVETCVQLCQEEALLANLRQHALRNFQLYSQQQIVRDLLAQTFG